VEDLAQILAREQHYIDTLKPEYNICPIAGRKTGTKYSLASCARISAALKGRKRDPEVTERIRQKMIGREKSVEEIAKLRAAWTSEKRHQHGLRYKGHILSHEAVEALRQINLGKPKSRESVLKRLEAMKGYRRPPEATEKQRAKMKGRKLTPEHAEKIRQAKLAYWAERRAHPQPSKPRPQHSATMKEKWADPDYRTRVIAAHKDKHRMISPSDMPPSQQMTLF